MMKFIELSKVTFKQYFIYRVNFLLWRFRVVLNLLIIYYLWSAIFDSHKLIFGYDKPMMITYILLSNIGANLALSSRTADVAGEILRGDLINYLLKPISFFRYQAARDIADKFINILFTIIEIAILLIIIKPLIFIQPNLINYLLFFIFLALGVVISFFINLSLSFIGFWSVEVWAPRFIFMIIVFFFSGTYFPLDILPKPIYYLLMTTPFPYLYYLPTRIYLGISWQLIPIFLLISIFWAYACYYLTKKIWHKGLSSFSFFGK